ncbi:cysteine hydrolase family protein [Filimonas lacunae]|nr:isochorismatase family cysteine hydrolase [Filimonas lacunae]
MNNTNSALLVMDMQTAVLGRVTDYNNLIKGVQKAISVARLRNIPVLYITVGFRPGMPEVSTQNKVFGASKARAIQGDMGELMKIDQQIAPLENDIIITKKRMSAFTGSDLEVVLRSLGVSHLILSGVATSGVVLSTSREAADKDYLITVLSDACADYDDALHSVLVEKVLPMQAEVITVAHWEES